MELFRKTKAVKLRCHNDKYLVADDDKESIRQSRNSSSRKAIWEVEWDEEEKIRLRSFHGRYLTASNVAFLLGMTGNKVVQTTPENLSNLMIHWQPIRDGFQVRLRSWCGTFLRANGGTPPWRNSITHDEQPGSATRKWILWDVQPLTTPFDSLSSFASTLSDDSLASAPDSPASTVAPESPATRQIHISSGMDFFVNAKAVRLKSHHDKYLYADEDEESVSQNRDGSAKKARWTVELVSVSESIIRLKSCYGKYLTASNHPLLLGMTGRKVVQSRPTRLDSSLEWVPIRQGSHVKLKTRYDNFLRANGGLPPWRNSVTHDLPHRTATQAWILWDVDLVEIQLHSPLMVQSTSLQSAPPSKSEPEDFAAMDSPPKLEGRTIYYQVLNEDSEDEANSERHSFTFKGNEVAELTRKLEQETGIEDFVVCSRSPLNGNPYPLRLQLPPNNATLNVVLVFKSSKLGRDFEKQGLI